jgi:hypothetical protein
VELGAVGDAHEVVVPRRPEVRAPEPDFESGWEGVRAAHGVPLGPVLGTNHHRNDWWEADLQRVLPYLAHQLSVRKVVPTLTSMSAEIYLSMADAKQHVDMSFILVPAMGHTSSRGALGAVLCCIVVLAEGGYKCGGRGGETSRSLRFD